MVRRQASPAYRAEVVAADGYLDLAVLRIVADVDGTPVDPDELDLTAVPIGQGRELRPLDELIVTGYPGIADTFAVRFSKGEVNNFSDDPRVGPDAWIHTDAKIAEGNSGGLAADASGRLVAIPTMTTSDGPDGAVDYNMRPVELALPLIEAARAGRPYDGSRYLTRPTGDEFARVQGWASESTEECVAGNAEPAFPSGTWELFPQVRFAGMSDGDPVLVELVELSSRARRGRGPGLLRLRMGCGVGYVGVLPVRAVVRPLGVERGVPVIPRWGVRRAGAGRSRPLGHV